MNKENTRDNSNITNTNNINNINDGRKKKATGRIVPSRYMMGVKASGGNPSSSVRKLPTSDPKSIVNSSSIIKEKKINASAATTVTATEASTTNFTKSGSAVKATSIQITPKASSSTVQLEKKISIKQAPPLHSADSTACEHKNLIPAHLPSDPTKKHTESNLVERAETLRSKLMQYVYFSKKSEKHFLNQFQDAHRQISLVHEALYMVDKENLEMEFLLKKLENLKEIHQSLENQEIYLTESVLALDSVKEPLSIFLDNARKSAWKMKSKSIYIQSPKDFQLAWERLSKITDKSMRLFERDIFQSYTKQTLHIKEIQDQEAALLSECHGLLEKAKSLVTHEASLRVHITQQLAKKQ